MESKVYLKRYRKLKEEKRLLTRELESIYYDIASPRAVRYDTIKTSSAAEENDLFFTVELIEKKSNDLTRAVLNIMEEMKQIEESISEVETGTYKRLLHLYYIEGVPTLEAVSKKMKIPKSVIRHTHCNALKELQVIIDNNNM